MKILLIEDEPKAANHLEELIRTSRPSAQILATIDAVEDARFWLASGQEVDLVFLDIHLSDGLAFDIFESTDNFVPIIFTTAYDHYAIKAFEVNSIDYLLKPISKEKLENALRKAEKMQPKKIDGLDYFQQIQQLLSEKPLYKENFLIPFKDKLIPVPVKDFAWFEIRNGVVVGMRFDKSIMALEERSLDDLIKILNPRYFFRANRQFIINRAAIQDIAQYFNGKLHVTLLPTATTALVISRERSGIFKQWLGS